MLQETQDKWQHPEKQVKDLLDQLHKHYKNYLEKNQQQEQSKNKITKMFGKWFAGFDPLSSDLMHQEFLDGVERIISELSIALKQLEQNSPELCNSFADKAVSRLMMPKPAKEKTTAEWYMTVAEYQCVPLLPYLNREVLEYYHDLMLKRVPRRMMYPKQMQLLDQMEEIIKAKIST